MAKDPARNFLSLLSLVPFILGLLRISIWYDSSEDLARAVELALSFLAIPVIALIAGLVTTISKLNTLIGSVIVYLVLDILVIRLMLWY